MEVQNNIKMQEYITSPLKVITIINILEYLLPQLERMKKDEAESVSVPY